MKSISTLIPDIYSLLSKGEIKIDAQRLGNMISKRLEDHSKGSNGPTLRMSSLGEKCLRKLWMRENKPEKAEPLAPHTILSFLIGDIFEEVILSLAEATDHTVELRQETVELEGVVGHIDGIIDGTLVDVKSANARSIDKFKNHRLEQDDPFGYMDQISAYVEALQGNPSLKIRGEAAFLAADKELGHLVIDRYKKRERNWREHIQRIRDTITQAFPPKRPYFPEPDGKSGNMQLPLPCRYCQFKKECWKDANAGRGLRKFIYSSGPRWLTHVERTPDVQEMC